MKILHFGFQADMASGIGNQLAFEQSAAASLSRDIEWDTKFFTLKHNPLEFVTPVSRESSEGLFVWVSDYFKLRNCAFNWLKRNSQKYDVVLLRYSSADPVQYFHSRWFDNVFTIHHSFEIEESRLSGGGKGRLKSYIEKQLGRSVVGRVKGVIGVTDEIARYEKARVCGEKLSYCYPNGIDLSLATLADDDRSGIPKVLMVASSFVSWHGLDLLVDSFKKSETDFELHIVGDVDEGYVDACGNDPRFIFHGLRDSSYVRSITAKCDVGLSCFALSRKGMTEACTLKVREYLASGLPVYSGHKDSALPDDFPFYQQGPPEATLILDFGMACRKIKRFDVRNLASSYIDKKRLMFDLAEWLSCNV